MTKPFGELPPDEQAFLAESYLPEYLDDEIGEFKRQSILTGEQLMVSIKKTRQDYQAEAISDDRKHSPAFYEHLDSLLARFEKEVSETTLPEPLNDWWNFSYRITTSGIQLFLNFYSWSSYSTTYEVERTDKFVLIDVSSKLLTVAEYAQIYGVDQVTVRQWIRRAKIRDAVKAGREWRIPELAEMPTEKGYTPCQYVWSEELRNLPEGYDFLNEFKSLSEYLLLGFWQDEDNKNTFYLSLFLGKKRGQLIQGPIALDSVRYDEILKRYPFLRIEKTFSMEEYDNIVLPLTNKQREELELYMISNPFVQCRLSGEPINAIAEFGTDYPEGSFPVESVYMG